ncbi:hypothetical protein GCM10011297_10470 [Bacterioplanes sanyensis]|uniref:CRISPR-associated endonuclease Cas2 n=1 Tax=Bacterioplanes sanyensis TaxID=1249553 RepID=UPI0016742090|nr:CRISPR-associated endonuclease Cas2 [Bacterioplanes sanyensis]GGY39171.1 hypothetical protein GCM10011297_10470 [Bacterioplanes sanyensis]
MSHHADWYLIAYDIRDVKRLRRVHRFLRAEGIAVQESVFAWYGDGRQLNDLQKQLRQLIDERYDDVRGYRLLPQRPLCLLGQTPFMSGVLFEGYPIHWYRDWSELASHQETAALLRRQWLAAGSDKANNASDDDWLIPWEGRG